MKRYLLVSLFLLVLVQSQAQLTAPVVRAGFGVEADLKANFFNSANLSGNDDWFPNAVSGTGTFIIDTTGAAALMQRYLSNPSSRAQAMARSMRFMPYSPVNGKMLIDGIFIRDFHGIDSTVFASGANKNCMNPSDWTTPVTQNIPDKNDILDTYLHIRRDGTTISDSLYVVGGISIANTTGNRYFDVEMYQTDIDYDRANLRFVGFGPDAGHTAWRFDSAGRVTKVGDVIFTANYPSSSLTNVEARIWIDAQSLSINPMAFNWGGQFDGATSGAQYGYANILPKTPGDYYTGLTSPANTWAGPFGLILQDESLVSEYQAGQYMEFSINLSKLGLDPWMNSNEPCKLPFTRVLIKSRASTSFTAQLKDFVGPFTFARPAGVDVAADLPIFCGPTGITTITVTNPLPASVYTWGTLNGRIISDTIGASITVNKPGTYWVKQELMNGCGGIAYAADTVTIGFDSLCVILKSTLKNLRASRDHQLTTLQWTMAQNTQFRGFDVERSADGQHFEAVGKINAPAINGDVPYRFVDASFPSSGAVVFYRLKLNDLSGVPTYSKVVAVATQETGDLGITLMPNPVRSTAFLHLRTAGAIGQIARVAITNQAGLLLRKLDIPVQESSMTIRLDDMSALPPGTYIIKVAVGAEQYIRRLIRNE